MTSSEIGPKPSVREHAGSNRPTGWPKQLGLREKPIRNHWASNS